MTLRQAGEERLLARILPTLPRNTRVVLPAGDDCALVKVRGGKNLLVLKSDCVVENVHFQSGAPAPAVGWKAMMRALSDFAAMSAVPEFALINLVISATRKISWVENLYRGLERAAARFDVAIVGGETSNTHSREVAVTVSLAGYVEPDRFVTRSGGKPRDDLFVTGKLGGSIHGRHLRFLARIPEARWLTANFPLHAMIDLSDGLGADLPHLARASNLNFVIDDKALPLARGCSAKQAISDGEDYELLFSLASRHRERLRKAWRMKFPSLLLTRIGSFKSEIRNQKSKLPRGYVHFQQRR